jgi:hypothetical protein
MLPRSSRCGAFHLCDAHAGPWPGIFKAGAARRITALLT